MRSLFRRKAQPKEEHPSTYTSMPGPYTVCERCHVVREQDRWHRCSDAKLAVIALMKSVERGIVPLARVDQMLIGKDER